MHRENKSLVQDYPTCSSSSAKNYVSNKVEPMNIIYLGFQEVHGMVFK